MTVTTTVVKVFQFVSKNDIDINTNHTNEIIEEAFDIALYYIPFHLRDSTKHEKLEGLPKSYLIPPSKPSVLLQHVANLCTEMRTENSIFFETLPKKIDLEFTNAKEIYMRLCKEVFHDGNINWGRIVSIFTLAGVFASHFIKNNEKDLVVNMPQWVKEFISDNLVEWIQQRGGWDDLTTHLSGRNNPKSWSGLLACTGLVVAAGYFVLIKSIGR